MTWAIPVSVIFHSEPGSDHLYSVYFTRTCMFSIASATSFPLGVSLISLILPLLSNSTNFRTSKVCSIFTAWLYVQSTSLAKTLPYLILVFFFKETYIKAGFLRKKTSKLSSIGFVQFNCIYSDGHLLINIL